MKKCCFLLVLALLAGCGGDNESRDENLIIEWSGNIAEQSSRFILTYDTDVFTESQLPKIERWWAEVQACAGVSLDISGRPLTLEYRHSHELPVGAGGWFVPADKYARVIESDLHSSGLFTRHEMLHYLIFRIHELTPSNWDHTHEFFDQCRDIII